MDKIGVLTYSFACRKAYDALALLKSQGYDDVTLFVVPTQYKKTYVPKVRHRPTLEAYQQRGLDLGPERLAESFGYGLEKLEDLDAAGDLGQKALLCCGAGIMPESFYHQNRIINAHPGYLPHVRGLDALKWAVYEGLPIGVTVHLIGDEVDAGEVLEQALVPVYLADTFHAVAQRQYEMEIAMLVTSIGRLDAPHTFVKAEGPLRRRMPNQMEEELFERFDKLKAHIAEDK